MDYHLFDCGCSWPIIKEAPKPGALPYLDFDPDLRNNKIPFTCKKTWELISRGETKGVFQLESNLGKSWSKELKPDNPEDISALGALLRPGALDNLDENDISTTKHYVLRKQNKEPVSSIHPLLDGILGGTFMLLTYQEQAMRISQSFAGFDLKEVDRLRKAMGKKDQKEMSEVGKLFLEKCKEKAVVPQEIAETVWNWIKASGRYSFNKSHSYSYGLVGYVSAYCKAHFPVQFFCSWIAFGHAKANNHEEVRDLIMDAKLYDVPVSVPDIRVLERHATTDFEKITFGISDVKGIGESAVDKLSEKIPFAEKELNKKISDFTWYEFLTNFSSAQKKDKKQSKLADGLIELLIKAGALSYLKISRNRMLAELDIWKELTDKEQVWILKENKWNNLTDAVYALGQPRYKKPKNKKEPVQIGPFGGCSNDKRTKIVSSHASMLKNPPSSQEDWPNWIANTEEELFGVSISCSRVDAFSQEEVNTSCKDFLSGKSGYMIFGVEILAVREFKCKRGNSAGKFMGFLTISDSSCGLNDVVVFPDTWEKLKSVLVEKTCVIMQGERDPKKNSLIVKNAVPM